MRVRWIVAALAAAAVLAAAGCGSSSSTTTSATAGGSVCANAHGHHKIKVALKVGAAYVSFKHFVVTPLHAGAFKKGAPHRTAAFVKAGATLAADAALLHSVAPNVRDDKQLCHIYSPFTRAAAVLGTIGAKLKSGKGTEADLNSASSTLGQVKQEVHG